MLNYIEKTLCLIFPVLSLVPVFTTQTLNMFHSNQTYSDIVCPTVSLWSKSNVIAETQCARCFRDDPSCVAFHYSQEHKACHFYNLTVFGAIFEGFCDSAPGFQFYMLGGALEDFWNAQQQVHTMLPIAALAFITGIGHVASTTDEGVFASSITESTGSPSVSDWTFRLVDGTASNNGRIEVFYNGDWAQLCDYYFNSEQAGQLCTALNISKHGFPIYGSHFGNRPGGYMMQNYECVTDHSWCNSEYMMSGICNSAGVECTDSPSFRLMDGLSSTEGRVEIQLAGLWGTVCSMGLHGTGNVKDLLCQHAGFSRSEVAGFNAGTGPIWLQYVFCDATAASVTECRIEQQPSCDHSLDLSLFCEG